MNRKLSQDDTKAWMEYSKGLEKINKSETEPRDIIFKKKEKPLKDKIWGKANSAVSSKVITQSISSQIFTEKNIDKKKLRDLRKGRIVPQAILDLHGLKRFEAQERVSVFVERSIKKKLRLILIITGKGKGSFDKVSGGILRKEFPSWISNLSQSNKILGIIEASPIHGGSGAFYVYMRKHL